MGSYKAVFNKRHTILPVIHVETESQALRNASIARECRCDGIFLINHTSTNEELLKIHQVVYEEFSDWWVGVNCLGLGPQEIFTRLPYGVAGVWVDNAMIYEEQEEQPIAMEIQAQRQAREWKGLYFGGVAFKYQRPVRDYALAARRAMPYMDVVTTSGPGTGVAAPVNKISIMKEALGDFPLAIASGITPDNVTDYLEVADCFLVATGIGKSFADLDPCLVEDLVNTVRSYTPSTDLSCVTFQGYRPGKAINSVCFVCEWNEGRSVHLELSTRHLLKLRGSHICVSSAGLSQGGAINRLRRDFLAEKGVPMSEITEHKSQTFSQKHFDADLVLVAELPMKKRLLEHWPGLNGRIMTIRGFLQGVSPDMEDTLLSFEQTHIEDAAGHSDTEKLMLYEELEQLAEALVSCLTEVGPKLG